MKITALIDSKLIEDVKAITQGRNITESIVIALKDWVSLKHLLTLSRDLKKKPIAFKKDTSAKKLRSLSRRKP